MNEVAEKLDVGRTVSFAMENIGLKPAGYAMLVAMIAIIGGLSDSLGRGGDLVGNIIVFIVGVLATNWALKVRYGDSSGIELRFGRAFGVSLLSGLGIALGFVLLIVPGFMLWTRWAVSMPAMMREDLGVTEAISRSTALTDGNRWALLGLGLGLLIYLPAFILLFLVGGLVGAFAGENAINSLWFNFVVNLLVGAVVVFASVALAEAYFTLSGERTHGGRLAEVFS